MILWFDEITSADLERVGGKGANLGECARAGLPVPPGFCVTTEAYLEATKEFSQALIADAASGDAAAARGRLLAMPILEAMEEAIREAYVELGEPMVAVRSSATAEDLADASFAGQQDTYLGVLGIDELLDAVRRCWASLWTDRAADYRRQQGVPSEGLALAVVVQEMIPAETAGVLFTRDPVTGDDSAMLASASYGLGESVVAALVTPDTFTLSRDSKQVSAREIGSKETRIDQVPGGGTTTTEVPEADRVRQSVTDAQLLKLLELGERVEAHYQSGQDIEWAFAGNDLYLLQARPITTSTSHPPSHAPAQGRIEHELRNDLIEHFPAPFPLDLQVIQRVMDTISNVMRKAGLRTIDGAQFVQGDDDGIIYTNVSRPRISARMLVRLPSMMVNGARYSPANWPKDETAFRSSLDGLLAQTQGLSEANDDALLKLIHDAIEEVESISHTRYAKYALPMFANLAIAYLLIRLARQHHILNPLGLYASAPYKTAEITAAISNLAATAREYGLADAITSADPGMVGQALTTTAPGTEFLAKVAAFLTNNGARTPKPWLPFSNRSWREEPEALYALLAASLRGNQLEQDQSSDPAGEVERRLPRFLRRLWRTNVSRLRTRHVAREGTLYLCEEFFCVARAGMDEIASRLVDRQQLENPEDIRFLYFQEVERAIRDDQLSLQPIIARRRRKRGIAEAVWWDRGEPIGDEGALHGVPASAGRATGIARVIRSPEEFHRLQAGEVLVCPYTDPTWTPLFALASAVVADTGGPLSHAAIVAREYGIPAVLGVPGATSLPDGATLLVDGSNGTVTITQAATQ